MKSLTLACLLSAGLVAAGCGNDESSGGAGGGGGAGGMGGSEPPTETRWAISDFEFVADDCNFEEPLEGAFIITTDGSTATMILDDPMIDLSTSADDYSPTDTEVTLTGDFVNEEFIEDGCRVQLDDEFRVMLDDTSVSLPDNTTLTVQWDHTEVDISDVPDTCNGPPPIWFAELPCEVAGDFTLTQLVE